MSQKPDLTFFCLYVNILKRKKDGRDTLLEKILFRVYGSKKLTRLLRAVSYACVIIGVTAFFLLLYLAYLNSLKEAILLSSFFAVPFFVVSISRRIFNAPRPYEIYEFYKIAPKDKKGQSFPSRHVFSSVIIAVFAFNYSALLGALLVVLSLSLALSRILLGIHFIRDCLAGALIGAISAAIGILLL